MLHMEHDNKQNEDLQGSGKDEGKENHKAESCWPGQFRGTF